MNDKIKNEIIRRMRALNLMPETIEQLIDDGMVSKSEPVMPGLLSAVYWIDEDEKKTVEAFEKKFKEYDAKVYHVIPRRTDNGKALTLLSVMNYETDKFYQDDFDSRLEDNTIMTHFEALNTGYFSESGSEYIVPAMGGIAIPYVANVEEFKSLRKFEDADTFAKKQAL